MDECNYNTSAEELDKEMRDLEEQIARTENDNEKRQLKRRLQKARYMRLLLLGRLG